MLSKNKIKIIRSLDSKKERKTQGLFVAEGEKVVGVACLAEKEEEDPNVVLLTDPIDEE